MARTGKLGTMYLVCASALILTVAACVLYVQRDQVLVHYQAHVYVSGPSAPAIENWLTERYALAIPVVLAHLMNPDAGVVDRAGELIQKILAEHAEPAVPEHAHLALATSGKLLQTYDKLSPEGRCVAVTIATQVLGKNLAGWSPNVPAALETAGAVLQHGLDDGEPPVRDHALARLAEVWKWVGSDGVARSLVFAWKRDCYSRAVEMLKAASPELRAKAAAALVGAPYHEGDSHLIALLDDTDPLVRKSALLAVARSAADSLSSEQKAGLIEFLQDRDPEVRQAATELLINAGVSNAVVRLATMMKDPRPAERLRAVSMAVNVLDDPTPSLLEMSNDPSPAVRLAVARAAAGSDNAELQARLHKFAENDADRNVREISKTLLLLHVADKK